MQALRGYVSDFLDAAQNNIIQASSYIPGVRPIAYAALGGTCVTAIYAIGFNRVWCHLTGQQGKAELTKREIAALKAIGIMVGTVAAGELANFIFAKAPVSTQEAVSLPSTDSSSPDVTDVCPTKFGYTHSDDMIRAAIEYLKKAKCPEFIAKCIFARNANTSQSWNPPCVTTSIVTFDMPCDPYCLLLGREVFGAPEGTFLSRIVVQSDKCLR